jgi:putative ABC transport system permease protein
VRKLTLKSIRDLRGMRLRGVMILLMIGCQTGIFCGGLGSELTLSSSVDTFCREHNLADLQLTFDVMPAGRLPELEDLPGVREVAARLVIQGVVELGEGRSIPAVIVFVRAGENPAIDSLQMVDGVFPSADQLGVVIERGLVGAGYGPGDEITVSAYGFTMSETIVGVARSPEYLVSTANPEMLIPTPGSLAIIYAPRECCEQVFQGLTLYLGGTEPVNQLLCTYEADTAPPGTAEDPEASILERLTGAEPPITVTSLERRDEQFGILFLQQDLEMFRIVVVAIVAVFSVVTLIVTGISVHRVVMSQRREIGALMAFGYGPVAIVSSHVRMGMLLGLGGALVGAATSPAVNLLLADTYASAISLPPVTLAFRWWHLAAGGLMGILVAAVAAALPVLGLTGLTPVQVMRGGADDAQRRLSLLARLAGRLPLLSSGSLPQRAAIRNLFRRPRLTAATVILIALGIGITAGFVITLTSVLDSSTALLQRDRWELIADLRQPEPTAQALQQAEEAGIVDSEAFVRGFGEVAFADRTGDYQIVGVPAVSTLRQLQLAEGTGFSGDDAPEIVFSSSFSDVAPPVPGDTVVLTSGGEEHQLTVVGLVSSLTIGQAYLPLGTARRILGLEGKCSGFLGRYGEADPAAVESALYGSGRVGRITVRKELEAAIDDQLTKATELITLAILMGALVALAIVINTMSMNILERQGEFATLMSLGYGRPPLARMVMTEVCLMGGLAVLLAVPVAFGIAGYMNGQLSEVWFQIDTHVRWWDLAACLLLPFLLLPLATVPALRQVFALDIALVVRQRTIE